MNGRAPDACYACAEVSEKTKALCPVCSGTGEATADIYYQQSDIASHIRAPWLPIGVPTPQLIYVSKDHPGTTHKEWIDSLLAEENGELVYVLQRLVYPMTYFTNNGSGSIALVSSCDTGVRCPLTGVPVGLLWKEKIATTSGHPARFWAVLRVSKRTAQLMEAPHEDAGLSKLVHWSSSWPRMPLVGAYRIYGSKTYGQDEVERTYNSRVLFFRCRRIGPTVIGKPTKLSCVFVTFRDTNKSVNQRQVSTPPIEAIDEELLCALGITEQMREFTLAFALTKDAVRAGNDLLSAALVEDSYVQNPLLLSRSYWALTPSVGTRQVLSPEPNHVDGIFILPPTPPLKALPERVAPKKPVEDKKPPVSPASTSPGAADYDPDDDPYVYGFMGGWSGMGGYSNEYSNNRRHWTDRGSTSPPKVLHAVVTGSMSLEGIDDGDQLPWD